MNMNSKEFLKDATITETGSQFVIHPANPIDEHDGVMLVITGNQMMYTGSRGSAILRVPPVEINATTGEDVLLGGAIELDMDYPQAQFMCDVIRHIAVMLHERDQAQ